LKKGNKLKEISLNVCQGVGDIFWVYQKFSPHFDKINFNILQIIDDNVQNRAKSFLKILPKIGEIQAKIVSPQYYDNVSKSTYKMAEIFKEYEKEQKASDYCCNKFLEDGIRIEQIDPDYTIQETVDLPMMEVDLPYKPHEYVVVYVSGSVKQNHPLKLGAWPCNKWSLFIGKLFNKYKCNLPVILIGASYDKDAIIEMQKELKKHSISSSYFVDMWPIKLLYLLKNSKFFIGYQSGLNVLADNLDVPQLMLYFPFLEKMLYSWPKKKNIESGIYNAAIFKQNINEIIKNINIKM
jgi:hypothetical protein